MKLEMIQANGDHAVGVDAVELHQSPALHGAPHLQTQAREAQEDGEQNEDDDGHRDGGEVDPVDRGPVGAASDGEVDGVRVEEREDRRGGVEVLGTEDHRQERGDPDQEGQATDELRRAVGIRDVAEDEPVEGVAHDRTHHHHGQEERLPPGPAVVLGQVREDERRGEGLRPEGEVEDPRRLIGQDQADRHERVRAPVGHARKREAEQLLHSLCLFPAPTLASPPSAAAQAGAGVPAGSGNTGFALRVDRLEAVEDVLPLVECRHVLVAGQP